MSATAPFMINTSDTINSGHAACAPARAELTGSRLFQFYMESFFKIPKDVKNDIIYCQRALKAHIKVHQMVLDVFQQQPDGDPQQKERILNELETEIYEINAEQHFLFLRLRRTIDDFYKMLKKNGIPTDINSTNALISREIVPFIKDVGKVILPIAVLYRNSEKRLIEKYFEVENDTQAEPQQCMEVINLDDDDIDGNFVENIGKVYKKERVRRREYPSTSNANNFESLLKNTSAGFSQTSLLKPMNQRLTNEIAPVDDKPTIKRTNALAEMYNQQANEKEELPVSTNVRMSRMNLRQALKRAQAAVRGPTVLPPVPPPPQSVVDLQSTQKTSIIKTRGPKASAAAVSFSNSATGKSAETSSSSEEGTPERGPTPTPNVYWPDELEETRTKAEEYGQEMFLRIFDLFTPEIHAQMQQRRSKRRRRCVQNNHYHYGSQASGVIGNELEPNKKKRKAFLLSPQVKKTLPAKRNKRRSADTADNSVPPSRSPSSSPDDKTSCNECFKGGCTLEQCEQCKLNYHPQCHVEADISSVTQNPKHVLNEANICPGCKQINDKINKKEVCLNKNLQNSAHKLELKIAMEKDRRQVLQRTGKLYKIQMNNIFKIVNSFKSEAPSNITTNNRPSTYGAGLSYLNAFNSNDVIQLD